MKAGVSLPHCLPVGYSAFPISAEVPPRMFNKGDQCPSCSLPALPASRLTLPALPVHLAHSHAGRGGTQMTIPQPLRGQSWLCRVQAAGPGVQRAWQALP